MRQTNTIVCETEHWGEDAALLSFLFTHGRTPTAEESHDFRLAYGEWWGQEEEYEQSFPSKNLIVDSMSTTHTMTAPPPQYGRLPNFEGTRLAIEAAQSVVFVVNHPESKYSVRQLRYNLEQFYSLLNVKCPAMVVAPIGGGGGRVESLSGKQIRAFRAMCRNYDVAFETVRMSDQKDIDRIGRTLVRLARGTTDAKQLEEVQKQADQAKLAKASGFRGVWQRVRGVFASTGTTAA